MAPWSFPQDEIEGIPTERPLAPTPDREAIAALSRGDRRGALAVLIKEYGQAVHRYCARVLGSRSLADDIHQIVFTQAFTDIASFSGTSTFRPWLYAIANHRCLDVLKGQRCFRARFDLRAELPEAPCARPSAEDQAHALALNDALNECLTSLNPRVRSAVVLRYMEDFTYEEMARICHERPGTMQARVARALPVLRRCLDRKGVK
jgi:RNA polymerase sigma factor (sigma-70 family)